MAKAASIVTEMVVGKPLADIEAMDYNDLLDVLGREVVMTRDTGPGHPQASRKNNASAARCRSRLTRQPQDAVEADVK